MRPLPKTEVILLPSVVWNGMTTTVSDVACHLLPWLTVGEATRLFSCCKRVRVSADMDDCTWRFYHSVAGLDPLGRQSGDRVHLVAKIVGTKRCRECGRPTRSLVRSPSGGKVCFPLCKGCAEDAKGYRRLVTRAQVRVAVAKRRERCQQEGRQMFRVLPCSLVPRAKISQTGACLYWPSSFADVF